MQHICAILYLCLYLCRSIDNPYMVKQGRGRRHKTRHRHGHKYKDINMCMMHTCTYIPYLSIHEYRATEMKNTEMYYVNLPPNPPPIKTMSSRTEHCEMTSQLNPNRRAIHREAPGAQYKLQQHATTSRSLEPNAWVQKGDRVAFGIGHQVYPQKS